MTSRVAAVRRQQNSVGGAGLPRWWRAPLAALVFARGASGQAPPPQPPPARFQPAPDRASIPPPTWGAPLRDPEAGPPLPPSAAASVHPPSIPDEPLVPPAPVHAPRYALWLGARLTFLGFGFHFYENERGREETTGNFVGEGGAAQLDVGARIARRFLPYVFWDHAFLTKGHRFEGEPVSTSSDYYGLGLRYVSGPLDDVGVVTELALGRRVITVAGDSGRWSMSGWEFFRLGLGVDVRLATLFTIEPMLSVATGVLGSSDGNIRFGVEGSRDGIVMPTWREGAAIAENRPYVVLAIGAGVHFDLFGE